MSNLLKIEALGGVNEYGRNCFYVQGISKEVYKVDSKEVHHGGSKKVCNKSEDNNEQETYNVIEENDWKKGNKYNSKSIYKRILLDCGIHKGSLKIPDLDKIDDIKKIDYVFLSHSHVDHYGAIKELYNNGYEKSVFMTRDTANQIKAYLYENNIKVNILEEVCDPLVWHKLDDDLSIFWGRNGHVQGAIWLFLKIRDKNVFYSGDFNEGDSLLPHDNPIEILEEYDIHKGIIDCGSGDLDIKYLDIVNSLKSDIKDTVSNGGNILFASNIYGKGSEIFLNFLMELDNVEFIVTKDFFEGIKSIINELSDSYREKFMKVLKNIFVIEAWHIFDDIDGIGKISYIESKDKIYWYEKRASNYISKEKDSDNISNEGKIYFISNMSSYYGIEYRLFDKLKDNKKNKIIFLNKQPKNSIGMELLERKSEFNADINYSNIKAHQSINEAKEMSKKMNISDSIFFHYKCE